MAQDNAPIVPPLFLTADELFTLTGKRWKSCQVDALRGMGIPFRINARGCPVVTRSAIEGATAQAEHDHAHWESNARKSHGA